VTTLERRLGFREATAANMLTMIGIGPFVTIPLLLASMHGPQAMLGWILGAVISICDGLIWAELGAAMPESGGPYRYLLEAYGPRSLGRLISFLFLWQLMAQFPLTLASGAVGFSQYSLYLWPHLTGAGQKLIAMCVCLASCALIYRRIQSIGRWSIAIWCVVMFAALWIVVDGLLHARLSLIVDTPPGAWRLSRDFWIGLGGATLFATYDYGGYNTVCLLGGEISEPARTIPRSILAAIGAVAVLYLTMNFTIIGVLPWRQAMQSKYVASEFMDRLHGPHAAALITVLVLVTAFASVYAGMLGFSRVPYAAAVDGRFFRVFARLDPAGHFPSFSVLFVGVTSAITCFFDLESIVKTLVVIQTLIQSLAVVGAATMLRATRPDIPRPFKMWLYPLPSVIAFAGWTYIIVTSGMVYIGAAFAMLAVGIAAYLWRAKRANEWPWT
jgi:amino acid transporter